MPVPYRYTKKDEPTDLAGLEHYYRELVIEFFGEHVLDF
jgi:hypothetical protein